MALAGAGVLAAGCGAVDTGGGGPSAPAVPRLVPPPAGNVIWRGVDSDAANAEGPRSFELGLSLPAGLAVRDFHGMWQVQGKGQPGTDPAGLMTETAGTASACSARGNGPAVVADAKTFLRYATTRCVADSGDELVAVNTDLAWEITSSSQQDIDVEDLPNEESICIVKKVSGGWVYLTNDRELTGETPVSPAAAIQAMKPWVEYYLPIISSVNGLVR